MNCDLNIPVRIKQFLQIEVIQSTIYNTNVTPDGWANFKKEQMTNLTIFLQFLFIFAELFFISDNTFCENIELSFNFKI